MAEFGIQCINDSGLVQIDSSFRNMEIVATGNGAGTQPNFWSYPRISFPACPEPPMLFLKTSGNGYVSFNCWVRSGSNYVGAVIHCWNTIGFSWFLAAPQFAPTSEPWGMHVFDASGKKVFDSARNYLKIVDALRVGVPHPAGGVTYPGASWAAYAHATTPDPYYCLMGGNAHAVLDGDESGTADYTAAACIQSNGTSSVFFGYRLVNWALPAGRFFNPSQQPYGLRGSDWFYQAPIIVGTL